jgi:hypothetical protein
LPEGSVQGALRTSVGCDVEDQAVLRLTPAERDKCSQTVGVQGRAAPAFMGVDPGKRSRFDLQAESDERRRADREGPMRQLVTRCGETFESRTSPSNLGGGCLPDSADVRISPH